MSVRSDADQTIFSQYAREIEEHWKSKEIQRRKYNHASPQLKCRRQLIEWLIHVCEQIKLSHKTVHLGVFLLDMFMDNHSIDPDRLQCVALVCIMLAAKFEEVEYKVPSISELNKFDGFRYRNNDFMKIEAMVLSFHNFALAQPTVAHFVEYYGMYTVRSVPEELNSFNTSLRQVAEISCAILAELMAICLKGFVNNSYLSISTRV
ncbi:cyclin-J-like [Macrosteles quadrilineatus]|uniref:cyclin-J-like n=1 Tax=Macrosteles quadrilineatus TaxID=74068 RepID=UPI0023E2F946|nr:cyclin-J-like [Macrosteles quadrilineatus]